MVKSIYILKLHLQEDILRCAPKIFFPLFSPFFSPKYFSFAFLSMKEAQNLLWGTFRMKALIKTFNLTYWEGLYVKRLQNYERFIDFFSTIQHQLAVILPFSDPLCLVLPQHMIPFWNQHTKPFNIMLEKGGKYDIF